MTRAYPIVVNLPLRDGATLASGRSHTTITAPSKITASRINTSQTNQAGIGTEGNSTKASVMKHETNKTLSAIGSRYAPTILVH